MTVEEGEASVTEADSTSQVLIVVPIIVAVILLAIAIFVLIKCYQARQKNLRNISETVGRQVAQTDATYMDSQYVMRDDEKNPNIFARTTTVQAKLRVADSVANTDMDGDAFSNSGASHSHSSSKFNYQQDPLAVTLSLAGQK